MIRTSDSSNGALTNKNTEQDNMTSERPKEEYYREAAQLLNTSDKVARDAGEVFGGTLAFLTRGELILNAFISRNCDASFLGIHQLATRSMDDALRSFEGVLAEKPTNLVALLGKVCYLISFASCSPY